MSAQPQPMYELLPAYIRLRDSQASGALRELLSIFEQQAGELRADLARMYDGWFIETCDEWLIPYIGDLVGAPPAPTPPAALAGRRERRVRGVLSARRATANAIAHGRRKGTAWILEELAADLAHWPACAVEFYRRLAITAHLDHLHAAPPALADLRGGVTRLDQLLPFESGAHLADVRRIASDCSPGAYNIANLGLFVWRERRYPVTATPAYCREDVGRHCFTFSALGIDTQLLRRPVPESERSSLAAAENLPLPLSRWALEWNPNADATSASADPSLYGADRSLLIEVADWPRRGEQGVSAAQVIPADLSDWGYKVPRDHVAVDPVLGRVAFNPSQAPREDVRVSYGYGFAADLGGGEYDRGEIAMPRAVETFSVWTRKDRPQGENDFGSIRAALAEWRRRRQLPDETKRPPAALRVELMESGVYSGRFDVDAERGETIAIAAAPRTRPIIWLADEASGRMDTIDIRGGAGSRVVLDGLLIAGRAVEVNELRSREEPERDTPGEGTEHEHRGFCEVLIHHSTLVPGSSLHPNCEPRRPAEPSIVLRDTAVELRVESSIVGAIVVIAEQERVIHGRIAICDSIVDATSESRAAIAAPGGRLARTELGVWRSTIMGTVNVHVLREAEDSVFAGVVTVARRQVGCMRFCYVHPPSRTPRRYRCQPDGNDVVPHFRSRRYGTSDYLRLTSCTPPQITRGAHDGAGMGVYHDLFEPQRFALLRDRLQEFVPASCDAAVVFVT